MNNAPTNIINPRLLSKALPAFSVLPRAQACYLRKRRVPKRPIELAQNAPQANTELQMMTALVKPTAAMHVKRALREKKLKPLAGAGRMLTVMTAWLGRRTKTPMPSLERRARIARSVQLGNMRQAHARPLQTLGNVPIAPVDSTNLPTHLSEPNALHLPRAQKATA